MPHIGVWETPDRRLQRLRSALASTSQSMSDTVTKAVDIEARRRTMEDELRRFREVERTQLAERRQRQSILDFRQQEKPGFERLFSNIARTAAGTAGFNLRGQELARPENLGGVTAPIPAQLAGEESRNRVRFQEILAEVQVNFPTKTPPGTTHESIALERLEKELTDQGAARVAELASPSGIQEILESGRSPLKVLAEEQLPRERGPGLLGRGLQFLEETPGVGGPLFRDPRTGKTAFEEGAEISRPVVQAVQPIVAEPFEQVEAAGIPVISPVSGGVATAIESKIVEDIATEVINPAALVFIAPVALSAASGLRGVAAAEALVSNLLATGMEPRLIRNTLRGLTLVSREGTAALPRIAKAVRETPIFQEALRGIREAPEAGGRPLRGGETGGFPERFAGRARRLEGGPPLKRPVTTFEEAKKDLVRLLDDEAKLRKTGVVAAEISTGRKAQAAGIRVGTAAALKAGVRGEEAATAGLRGARAPAGLRQTVGELNLSLKQTDALFDEATRLFTRGELEEFEFIQATVALKRGLSGRGLQPKQIDRLRSVFGVEVAEKLSRRVRPISEARQAQKAAGALSKTLTKVLNTAVRETRKSVAVAERSRKAADLGNFRAARSLMEESIRAANRSDDAILIEAEELLTEARAALEGASPAALKTADRQVARLRVDMADKFANPEDLIAKAQLAAPDDPVVQETIREWVRGNEILLEGLSSEMGSLFATTRAVITGDIADSFLTLLSHRRAGLSYVLSRLLPGEENLGAIRKITDALMEAELRRRYGVDVPDKVRELLAVTKGASYDQNAGAIQVLVQRAKNTAFGFDIGVFGIQGLTAVRTGNIPMVAGMINRMLALLHLPHVTVAYGDVILPRWTKYALDGVHQGIGPSAVRAQEGTLLQYLGPLGKAIDKPLMAIADKLNHLQFGYALTALRNLTYEGNLVLAHLARDDIANVAVRAQLADNANAIGSFAHTALRAGRAGAEKGLLISAPMTRAMVNRVLQVSKVFRPGVTKAERLMGASMIASYGMTTLAVGKLIHDRVGVGDFVFDPSKPGFGLLNLASGRTVNLFPQATLEKAILRSFRELAKMEDADVGSLAQVWARLGLGRSSIVGQAAASVFDTGWDPRFGFRFGELGIEGKILSLVPMPPIIESLVIEGPDPFAQAAEITGVSEFQTSPFVQLEERFKEKALAGEFGPDRVQNPDFNPEADFRIAEQDPDLAPLVEALNRRGIGSGAEGAVRSRQLEETRAETERDLGLPEFATQFNQGNLGVGSTLMSRYQDLQTQMAGSFNLAFLKHSPKERESEDGQILEELGKLNPRQAPYTDFETGITDWDRFYADVFALEDQLSPAVFAAREAQLYSVDPELRALEPDIKRAVNLRRESFDMPRFDDPSKTTEELVAYERQLQDFMDFVRVEVARAKREFGPDFELSLPDAARILGKRDFNDRQLGEDAAAIFGDKVKRNPDLDDFLIEHQRELVPFFPDLYRRKDLQAQLDDDLFEVVIGGARAEAGVAVP